MKTDRFGIYLEMQRHIDELQAASDRTLCDMLAAALSEGSDKTLINKCSAYLFIRITALEERQRRELREYVVGKTAEQGYVEVQKIFDADNIKDAITHEDIR